MGDAFPYLDYPLERHGPRDKDQTRLMTLSLSCFILRTLLFQLKSKIAQHPLRSTHWLPSRADLAVLCKGPSFRTL